MEGNCLGACCGAGMAGVGVSEASVMDGRTPSSHGLSRRIISSPRCFIISFFSYMVLSFGMPSNACFKVSDIIYKTVIKSLRDVIFLHSCSLIFFLYRVIQRSTASTSSERAAWRGREGLCLASQSGPDPSFLFKCQETAGNISISKRLSSCFQNPVPLAPRW